MVGFKIFLKTVLKEEMLDVSVYSYSWVHKFASKFCLFMAVLYHTS